MKIKILTVADLHRSQTLYAELDEAVREHRPDIVTVVGDFLDATGIENGKLRVEDCAQRLSRLPCPEIVFVRGNHEDSALWTFAEEWKQSGREFSFLECSAFTYGPLVIVGFPCLMLAGDGLLADVPADPNKWLPQLVRPFGPAARTLWLMHEPPYRTPLSQKDGPLCGHIEWRESIERFFPKLVVCGHDHNTPRKNGAWNCDMSGGSVCVNVGQTVNGPLHYAVVAMEFRQGTPSLPQSITVTAFPAGKSRKL